MRAFALALLSAWLWTGAAQAEPAGLALTPCPVPGGTEIVRCGHLTVPDNWTAPNGRTISLNIVVLPKLGPEPESAPVFWLDGGPGVAATGTAALYSGELKFHRDRRALVLVDQRGTGGSNSLHCPATEAASPLDDLWPDAAIAACRRALTSRADLSQYTTDAAARDLEAVRAALGRPGST